MKAKPINSGALPRRSNIDSGDLYVPVSPFMIFADTMSNFALYYRQGDNIVLYLKERELLTAQLKQRLHDNGISTVYVRKSQVKEYLEHAEGNLGKVLSNEEIPLKERAKCFAGVSRSVVREVYEKSLGDTLKSHGYDRISDLVKSSVQFLSTPEGLKQFATLTDHHYSTFNHCINVFAYVTAILSHLGAAAEDITHCGIAAMLHDIGKSKVPVAILDKPGQLDDDEWRVMRQHPARGVALVNALSIPHQAYQGILFHHERFGGGGYPADLQGEAIPLVARVICACDVYDALTSQRAYAPAESPFKAIQIMCTAMKSHFDPKILKGIISVLSGAKIIKSQ